MKVVPRTEASSRRERCSADKVSRREVMRACRRLGDLEGTGSPTRSVGTFVLCQDAPVGEHPEGLDGIEGDALGALEDLVVELIRQVRDEALEELGHSLIGEGLQVQRGEAALSCPPVGTAVHELGSRQA